MCVINFNIVTVGTSPTSADGRYRPVGSSESEWVNFNIDLQDQKTPDIMVNGEYFLQVRVQYPNTTYSEWTPSSLFKVGNCSKLGNLYKKLDPGDDPATITEEDFNLVLYSNNTSSGSVCYSPSTGDKLYEDSDLTIGAQSGDYLVYGSFAGCFNERKVLQVTNGVITQVSIVQQSV